MITCTVKGDFKKLKSFLRRNRQSEIESLLVPYAEEGVEALKSAHQLLLEKLQNLGLMRSLRNEISIL